MLNADGHSPESTHPLPIREWALSRPSLRHWIHHAVGKSQAEIKMRLRGNNLHILCESDPCLDAALIVPRLKQAIATTPLASLLPLDAPPIYRVVVYGRAPGQTAPTWTTVIDLNWQQADGEPTCANDTTNELAEQDQESRTGAALRARAQGAEHLARTGKPEAIARYLSDRLSLMGIAVRARVEACGAPQAELSIQNSKISSALPIAPRRHRLLIACESAYAPDFAVLADPIAQHLRELELTGFRDAVVFGQVCGETNPEWMLRVDLTPPEYILREWARWGDVQAITRLLNRSLLGQNIRLSALLKEATLHLSCTGMDRLLPDKEQAIAIIAPLLQTLVPQGIHAAALYGVVKSGTTATSGTPAWVHWLELPAATRPDLAMTTLDLARSGDLEAIAFLLTRLLNPDLDAKLATGGTRAQIRQKGDLLHIMTDAPHCPRQDVVGAAIVKRLKPLQISSISGVRVYGRRSGQKHPLWSYGVDFVTRNRLVPEATPEFAASDLHVEELLSPPGAIVPWIELPPDDQRSGVERSLHKALAMVQRSLLRTQLFVPASSLSLDPHSPPPTDASSTLSSRQRTGVALIWGTVGLLLVLQCDWVVGQWLQISTRPPAQSAPRPIPSSPAQLPPPSPLANLALNKPKAKGWDSSDAGFTQPGTAALPSTESSASSIPGTVPLLASPLKPKAEGTTTSAHSYPSFNSRQFDDQFAAYQQYLATNGAPDVLVVGSSRALRGIDPAALRAALAEQGYNGVKVFDFGINGATARVVDWLVREVIPPDQLPKLILFADGARAFNSGRQDITYNGITGSEGYRSLMAGKAPSAPIATATSSPGTQPPAATGEAPSTPSDHYQIVNQALNQKLAAVSRLYAQRDRLKTKILEQLTACLPSGISSSDMIASSDTLLTSSSPAASAATGSATLSPDGQGAIDVDGFLPLPIKFNPVTYYQKYARVSGDYDSDYDAFSLEGAQTDALVSLAQFTKDRHIPLVFINLPLTKQYLDPARKRHEEAFQQHMLSLAPQLGFLYRDLSGSFTTQPDYFSDPSHLNRFGAYEVSHRLAQDVMIPWQNGK